MADLHDLPWVMAGDFNEPLSESDKFGGRGVSVNRTLEFKDCLDACNMIDLGFRVLGLPGLIGGIFKLLFRRG